MLINLRNALMAGKRLPYDAEVEYLESTGTQRVDTGVAASNDLRIELLLYNLAQSQNSLCPVGVFDNSSGSAIRYSLLANSGGIYYFYCGTSTNVEGKRIPFEQWVRFTMSGFTLTWQTPTTSGTYTVPISPDFRVNTTMSLFARNRMLNGVLDYDAFWPGRIAACKIYLNGLLVRDYIPVRKGTVGYLYDRVSGKLFGNAGTGDFVLGPDVVPVEYIESHGTEWIDTGRPITSDFWFDATMDITGTNGAYKTLLGARIRSADHDYQFSFQGANNYFLARYGNNSPQYYSQLQTGMTRIRIESGGKLYINESFALQLGVGSPSDNNMFIFALNNNGAVSQQAKYIRLYSLKYGGVNEEHNFRPVRVGTDATSWEGAMMDTLTRRIYRNAGTGAFTFGNDLKYPIPSE